MSRTRRHELRSFEVQNYLIQHLGFMRNTQTLNLVMEDVPCVWIRLERTTSNSLTFRHRVSYIQDRRTATPQSTFFIYLVNKYI